MSEPTKAAFDDVLRTMLSTPPKPRTKEKVLVAFEKKHVDQWRDELRQLGRRRYALKKMIKAAEFLGIGDK